MTETPFKSAQVYPTWLRTQDYFAHREKSCEDLVSAEPNWIKMAFSALQPEHRVVICEFLNSRPYKYFDRHTAERCYQLLESDPDIVVQSGKRFSGQLSHALQVMARQAENTTEDPIEYKNPQDIERIESLYHPEYQIRSEHVLHHLLKLPLAVLEQRPPLTRSSTARPRKKAKKAYSDVALGNVSKLLESHGYPELAHGFRAHVRNAIAHGTVAFEDMRIRYDQDKDDTPVHLAAHDFADLKDRLEDTVHAIAFAISLFYAQRLATSYIGPEMVPTALRAMWAREYSREGDAFVIRACIETSHPQGGERLMMHCSSDSRVREQYIFFALRFAYSARHFGLSSYRDYYVHIDVGRGVPSSMELPLSQLDKAFAEPNADSLAGINSLLWHDGHVAERYYHNLKLALPVAFAHFKQSMASQGLLGFDIERMYEVRHIENISVGNYFRLKAQIVIKIDVQTPEDVQRIAQHAIKSLRKSWVRSMPAFRKGYLRGRVRHMYIYFHLSDARVRKLRGRGLVPDYLMWVEWPKPNKVFSNHAHWKIGPGNSFAHVNRKCRMFGALSHLDTAEESA